MSKKTIVLTGRRPVTIETDEWPVIASAKSSCDDGDMHNQANQKGHIAVMVRKHGDGRCLIYGSSELWGALSHDEFRRHAGKLLPEDHTESMLVAAINEVVHEIKPLEVEDPGYVYKSLVKEWITLADECIAELPAEEI